MKLIEKKKIYRLAVYKWGVNSQLGMLIEESAELIQSTNKLLRVYEKNKETEKEWDSFAEEIADVEIMIEQMKLFFDWQNFNERVEYWKEKKLERLSEIVGELK